MTAGVRRLIALAQASGVHLEARPGGVLIASPASRIRPGLLRRLRAAKLELLVALAPRPWLCSRCQDRYPMGGSSLCFVCSRSRLEERPVAPPRPRTRRGRA